MSGIQLPSLIRGWPADSWLLPCHMTSATSSAISTSNLLTFLPFIVPKTTRIVAIGIRLQTAQAGGEAYLGLYADSQGNNMPGSLLVDGGAVDLSSGAGATPKSVTIDYTAAPGLYWSACFTKGVATGPSVTRISAVLSGPIFPPSTHSDPLGTGAMRGYSNAIASYGPLPASAPALTADISSAIPTVGLLSHA